MRRRHRCCSCLAALDVADALVTADEDGALIFCDEACAEDFERQLDDVPPPQVADRLPRASRSASRRELADDWDPIAEDTDD